MSHDLSQILNLSLQTELLESLGWDEQLLAQLLQYLENEFENFYLKSPLIIISEIQENFGEAPAVIIGRIFEEQLKTILTVNRGDIHEH